MRTNKEDRSVSTLICLEENIQGYARKDQKLTGHLIISLQGLMRCYVQNLDKRSNANYALYLFSQSKNKAIRVGSFNVDDYNREKIWQVNVRNVLDSGVRATEIDAAGIVEEGEDLRNTHVVLIGYQRNKYSISSILEQALPYVKNIFDKVTRPHNHNTTGDTQVAKSTQNSGTTSGSAATGSISNPSVPSTTHITGTTTGTIVTPAAGTTTGAVAIPGIQGTQGTQGTQATSGATSTPFTPSIPSIPSTPGTQGTMGTSGTIGMPGITSTTGTQGTTSTTGTMGTPSTTGTQGAITTPSTQSSQSVQQSNIGMIEAGIGLTEEGIGLTEKGIGLTEEGIGLTEEGIGMLEAEFGQTGASNAQGTMGKVTSTAGSTTAGSSTGTTNSTGKADSNREVQIERLVNESMKEKSLSEFVEDIKKELMKILKEDGQDQPHQGYEKEPERVKPKRQEIGLEQEANLEQEIKTKLETSYVQEDYNEQTEEEANYLREIERKLKDIQDRLRNTDIYNEVKENSLYEPTKDLEALDRSIQDPEDAKIEEIYESAQKVTPFKDESINISWAKISLAELISLPRLSYEWCTQPFITFAYYKYNHLLLGKDNNLNQYYVGIPDIYHPDRRYVLSSEQIDKFICCENIEPQIGEYGYWIIRL